MNQLFQETFNSCNYEKHGNLGGVTYFDKVVQYINRQNFIRIMHIILITGKLKN